MAKIRFEGEEHEVADGASLLAVCEEMGLPLGCTEGDCGTCRCEVVEGAANLEPLNDKELEMELEKSERLACQCVIREGVVEFSLD